MVQGEVIEARRSIRNVQEIFSIDICCLRLAKVVRFAANSITKCGIPQEKFNKNSSGDEIANVLVNDDIAHT